MTRSRLALLALVALLVLAPAAAAKPRASLSGALNAGSTLTAKGSGGTVQSITWERCETALPCKAKDVVRVGTGATYLLSTIDVDRRIRVAVKVKPAKGRARTVRSGWKGPVKPAVASPGQADGIPAGEYEAYTTVAGVSRLWIDSASTYRTPSGTPGTYRLVPGAPVKQNGAVKIDFLTGTYAEWENDPADPLWAEYVPIGTATSIGGQPSTVPMILMTFSPDSIGLSSSGWTTYTRK